MKDQYTCQVPSGKADLYVTRSLAMFRQYGFWYDTNKVYQFVPTLPVGYAMLMQDGRLIGERPMKAWAVYRPCALQLAWSYEKVVTFFDLELECAKLLQEAYPESFTVIKPKYGNTL